ncbi:hypothetical protein KA005_20765 [bacterium]|nr:hypothetical protein [bacterium]
MKKMFVLIVLAMLFVGACGPVDTPKPATATIERPITYVTLHCPGCADIGMAINLWNTPSRSSISGKANHGDTCTVTDTDTYDGLLHYKVKCGSQAGWVSENLVR